MTTSWLARSRSNRSGLGDDAGGQQADIVDAGRVKLLGQRDIPGEHLGDAES